ncbi:hypothetical protein EC9_28730 [Rosistilla ulvae]|uniref:Uncharacterized protein n=1 Tax=Rosistilla ulvae TaxID=1930277 RepID=A0A517M1C3_9BACT|nr:hypothetical protein EC9_28730 [Rosistilla ulvae]
MGSNDADWPRDSQPRTSLRWFDPPFQTAFGGAVKRGLHDIRQRRFVTRSTRG